MSTETTRTDLRPSAPAPAEVATAGLPVDVTVIIPTLHRERQLVEAVSSVLRQTGVSSEVLVIDDSEEGSARSALQGLDAARIRYVHRLAPSHMRPGLVRNDGIRLARGRFLVFLDDDDQLTGGALSALAGALDGSPSAGAAIGVVQPVGEDPEVLRGETAYFQRAATVLRSCRSRFDLLACLLFESSPIVNSACMIRRDLARAIGGYDPRVQYAEDADLYARAIRATDFVFLDRPVVLYRTGTPSMIHGAKADDVAGSYAVIRSSYRSAHGLPELLALRVLARVARLRRREGASSAHP